jgi:hypothetical protein
VAIPDEILSEIDARLPQALTLTVGRVQETALEAFHLVLADNAASALRGHCETTRERIADAAPIPYTATAELAGGQYFLIDDEDTLNELTAFRQLSENLGSISQITPADLDLAVKMYAVTIGDGPTRTSFVRRTDPQLRHRSGRVFAIGQERLSAIEGPVFAFSADFDFVFGDGWVVVLDQRSFEVLFRQIGLVEQHISTWISGITDHLPMNAASVAALREVALRDSRTWRRLRDIEHRGHLASVTLDEVRDYAGHVGLEPDKVVVDDELVFDPAERFGFLHLLNEDLYTGPLTGEAFESQRKSSME